MPQEGIKSLKRNKITKKNHCGMFTDVRSLLASRWRCCSRVIPVSVQVLLKRVPRTFEDKCYPFLDVNSVILSCHKEKYQPRSHTLPPPQANATPPGAPHLHVTSRAEHPDFLWCLGRTSMLPSNSAPRLPSDLRTKLWLLGNRCTSRRISKIKSHPKYT